MPARWLLARVPLPYNGHQGRPSFDISELQICLYWIWGSLSRSLLHVSTRKVERRISFYGLTARGHSQIPEEVLDVRVVEIKQFNPNCGSKVLTGYLAAQGTKISRERIRQSLRRVDPIGVNAVTEEKHWYHLPGYLKPLSLELKKAVMQPLTKVEQHLQVLCRHYCDRAHILDTMLLLCTALLFPRLQKKY